MLEPERMSIPEAGKAMVSGPRNQHSQTEQQRFVPLMIVVIEDLPSNTAKLINFSV